MQVRKLIPSKQSRGEHARIENKKVLIVLSILGSLACIADIYANIQYIQDNILQIFLHTFVLQKPVMRRKPL